MSFTDTINEKFSALQQNSSRLQAFRQKGFDNFQRLGIPGSKNEEWKYTRISALFSKNFEINTSGTLAKSPAYYLGAVRLPGSIGSNELVFINGVYSKECSRVTDGLFVMPLEDAARSDYKTYITAHLGHSSRFMKDGLNALNTAFTSNGLFILLKKGRMLESPVYIYHYTDTNTNPVFVQPRILFVLEEDAQAEIIEHYINEGTQEAFTNEVFEIVVKENARLEYYKVQNEKPHCHHAGTTHIRQSGRCFTHCVTVTLNGGTIRNNLNLLMEAAHNEGHMYGLYMGNGNTHIDNHTIVDNQQPNCFSNELYKGIMDGNSTGVFNGKIFVQQDAQKTNAYQSNKNILVSDNASVNTKPQLEIYADDVKCSHGCTIGQLDEEAMFYMRSRGIDEKRAKALLLHAFASDIIAQVKPENLQKYLKANISRRLLITDDENN